MGDCIDGQYYPRSGPHNLQKIQYWPGWGQNWGVPIWSSACVELTQNYPCPCVTMVKRVNKQTWCRMNGEVKPMYFSHSVGEFCLLRYCIYLLNVSLFEGLNITKMWMVVVHCMYVCILRIRVNKNRQKSPKVPTIALFWPK